MAVTGLETGELNRVARGRKRPEYSTVSTQEAQESGYQRLTSDYATRQFQQCDMLDHAIADLAGRDIKLVRSDDGRRVSIWRRKEGAAKVIAPAVPAPERHSFFYGVIVQAKKGVFEFCLSNSRCRS
jgi:hypothetical protein